MTLDVFEQIVERTKTLKTSGYAFVDAEGHPFFEGELS